MRLDIAVVKVISVVLFDPEYATQGGWVFGLFFKAQVFPQRRGSVSGNALSGFLCPFPMQSTICANMLYCLEFIASHPITDSWYVGIPDKQRGGLETLALHDCKAQDKWRICLSEQINQSSLTSILMAMNKQYILCFLKIANPHISDTDLAEALRNFWSDIEHINDDVNVKQEKSYPCLSELI